MEFRTKVVIPKATFPITYQDRILLLGSCFAENIGEILQQNKFTVDINPFGILYNPSSIASCLKRLLHPEHFSKQDLFLHEGVYHSFSHHSRFSSYNKEEALKNINERLYRTSGFLNQTLWFIITFGTSYVYRLKEDGKVVSNCHKLPDKIFQRERLSVSVIIEEWKQLLLSLWEHYPDVRILFTVSPIRHWKDGAHANQLSKSTLLLAIDELMKHYPERVIYFPAYEIIMDELRDYRFYAEDMLHPSSLAVRYIWERFEESLLSPETRSLMKEWEQIRKAIQHKPFQPESKSHQDFLMQTLLKAEQLKEKFPYFDLMEEIAVLRSKLK